jgi:hypothetical protein
VAVEITVQGEEFRRFQAKLKTLDKDIQRAVRKEMNATIRAAAVPVTAALRDAARDSLPHTGGYGERVSDNPVKVSIGQRGVVVKFFGMDAKSAERGRLRHPVFGNRQVWVNQSIKPGWFTAGMHRQIPTFRLAIMAAVERGLQQAEGV